MSRLLKPIKVKDPQGIINLIIDDINEIRKGAIVLDTKIGNKEYGYIHIVAVNEKKQGMFFFINPSGLEIEFLQFFKCLCWYKENINLFKKLYTGIIDFTQPPLILFMAPYFSASIQRVLYNVIDGEVTLLKFSCFQEGEEEKVFIERITGLIEKQKDPLHQKHTPDQKDTPALKEKEESVTESAPVETEAPSKKKDQPNLEKFRQEVGIDLSEISDKELLMLLE